MPSVDFVVATPVKRTSRVVQVEGQFDLESVDRGEFHVHAELPIEDRPWQIGAFIGPSGSGKSTLMRQVYGDPPTQQWDGEASLLDGFPASMTVQQVTRSLSSVGFSTPPAWVRPFHTLSNGEQFRVSVARALCSDADPIIIDEFTSVVDRTVARIGAAAIAKHVRRDLPGRHLVIASCHEDVVDWLQPDWVYETGTQSFLWRSLQRRPRVTLEIYRTTAKAWRYFAKYHYLSQEAISPSAFCLVACIDKRPVAFVASIPQMGQKAMQRISRTVVLPDYQGLGLGVRLTMFSASLHKAMGYRVRGVTSHPARVQGLAHSPYFVIDRMPSMKPPHGRGTIAAGRIAQSKPIKGSSRRLTTSWEYIGPPATRLEAAAFGVTPPPT